MPDVNLPAGSEGQPPVPGQTVPPKPGEKTDPALLLESLKDEREKRRLAEDAKIKAEADLQALQDALASGDQLSEEGKVLKSQITTLEEQIASLNQDKVFSNLQVKYPALKDKAPEFTEFKKNYPGVGDEEVAKLFLSENNLLVTPPTRKGLEQPSGGGRTPQSQGLTVAEVGDLRKNNFRQYLKLVREGKIPENFD